MISISKYSYLLIFLFSVFVNSGFSSAQTKELPIEVHLMKAVIIDMEMDFAVGFNEKNKGVISVGPSLLPDDSKDDIRPAVVRVTGGGAEALIDVETNNINFNDNGVTVYDFDIINKGAGSSAIVMPDSNEDSFLLSIGGKVNGLNKKEIFSSVNFININYL